jgi:hypothetical protein
MAQEPNLEDRFSQAMLKNDEAAPFHSPRVVQMVHRLGGKEAASRLLATKEPSEGFTKLFLTGGKSALKLSLEYLVLQNPWRELFTDEQLTVARKRLLDVECDPPPEVAEGG